MMRKKIGLFGEDIQDENLINDILDWMYKKKADYTNTFCSLIKQDVKQDRLFQDSEFINWYHQWQDRLTQNNKSMELSLNLMRNTNPLIIPRNHKVEKALEAAYDDDLMPMHNLLEVLKNPYKNQSEITSYQCPPDPSDQVYRTFCGT